MIGRVFRQVVLVLVLGLSASLAADDAVHGGEWQAGVAKVRITPDRPMWMSGYASRTHPADGTTTELWAKALVLQDQGGHRALLVTLDLVGVDYDFSTQVCATLKEKYQPVVHARDLRRWTRCQARSRQRHASFSRVPVTLPQS